MIRLIQEADSNPLTVREVAETQSSTTTAAPTYSSYYYLKKPS